jgi:hypothetical protein
VPIVIPILLIIAGVTGLVILVTKDDRPLPDNPPDLPQAPGGATRWRRVNAILPQLQQAAQSSGVPLGVLVGWIAKESGGRLDDVTRLDERGLFQLMPSESQALGLDHRRLSTDLVYSINAGLALIGKYMGDVAKLGVARKGTEYYWKLVKLCHTMGSGATRKIVDAAQAAGVAGSWESLRNYAVAHDSELLHATKHSPVKWFPLVDAVFEVGAPFGTGSAETMVAGFGANYVVPNGKVYEDIPDPLDCL